MATATSETRNWLTLATLTLENISSKIFDNISEGAVFYMMLQRQEGGYKSLDSLGERARIPVLHTLNSMQVYDGADELKTDQPDTHTNAFYDWRAATVNVTITGMDEAKNMGEHALFGLLEERFSVANISAQENFNKFSLQGDAINGNTVNTAYVDPDTTRSFVDPLFKIISKTGTNTVGSIDPTATGNSWWQNLFKDSTATTYATFDDEIELLHLQASRGPLGRPNLHLVDENVFIFYKRVRRAAYRETDFTRIDIPFENVAFHGAPVVPDQHVPDVNGDDLVLDAAAGTWAMLNTRTFQIQYLSSQNFAPTDPIVMPRQDATLWYLRWKGALVCGNRKKNALLFGLNTAIAS